MGLARVALFLRHPDAPVVAQRFAHQRELRLMIAADRDAGRMNLRVTRVREACAFLVSAPGCGDVATLRVGREIKNISVTARREHHGVGGVRGDFPGHEITHDNALGMTVDHDHVQHLGARKHLHCAQPDLPFQRLIRAEQKLLSGLATRVKRARNLCAAKRAVRQ